MRSPEPYAVSSPTQPSGLRVLFFTEMWERFSYYGMRALLVLYMTQALHFSVGKAATIYGAYTGLVYLTPVVGGALADRWLGADRAIRGGCLLMAAGHFVLAAGQARGLYPGLGLIVLGNGLFKPNVSVLVGRLYERDDPRRDAGFALFYMGINLGALLAPLVCGTLGQRAGWSYGFASAGIGMGVSWVLYSLGAAHVADGIAAADHAQRKSNEDHAGRADASGPSLLARIVVLGVLAIFGNIIFWASFEQAGSSLALFVDRYVDWRVGKTNLVVPSSWYQALNPLCILALSPLAAWAWVALARRRHEPGPVIKFAVGLALASLSFIGLSMAGARTDAGQMVPMFALVAITLLATAGELCVSPVGLALVSRWAPPAYVSAAMGLWMASMALANVVSGLFAGQFDRVSHARFFAEPALACAACAALLAALAKPLQWVLGARGQQAAETSATR